jgi:lipoprotein-anchoring transpeptidase ErfK/SrfK
MKASRCISFAAIVTGFTLCAPSSALAEKWKPHPITVLPGVPMRAADIKPYVAPNLGPEPPLEPSETAVVEVTVLEAAIELRPGGAPLAGNAVQGARLPVKGQVKGRGCSGKPWYALEPFGYLCSRDAKPTELPATTEQVLKVKDGERLPFHYVMVLVKEGDKVPLWGSFDALKRGDEPERQLEHGDTIAIERPLNFDGERYWLTAEGKVMPQKGASMMGPGSAWQGVALDENTTPPFGWITPDHAPAYNDIPEGKVEPATTFDRRTRVKILEEQTVGKKRWLKVAMVAPPPEPEERAKTEKAKAAPAIAPVNPPPPNSGAPEIPVWVNADQVNEVRVLARPSTVPPDVERWIDVDLGEQVLVLYENDKPVFATLVSSGRAIPTPMGTYPVWAKVAAITMKNQPYEDKGYFVNKVPWSTFFQWHNAIHGAYWHDRFGVSKSHGCVNVAPLDARHVFEWVSPPLPPGWSGLRPVDLLKSPYVVVRNSHAKKQFRQDRPIGPPDRELEGQRLEEAEKRRAEEAATKAATPTAAPDPAQAPPAP